MPNTSLSRRTALKGLGVSLALPWLESARTAAAAIGAAGGAAVQPPVRMAFLFVPNGAHMPDWTPTSLGYDYKLPYILEGLDKVREQTVVLSGMWSQSAEPPEGTTGSDHWVAAAYLTGIKPRKTAGSDATVGSATIDQIIAKKIGQETLLPSLQRCATASSAADATAPEVPPCPRSANVPATCSRSSG